MGRDLNPDQRLWPSGVLKHFAFEMDLVTIHVGCEICRGDFNGCARVGWYGIYGHHVTFVWHIRYMQIGHSPWLGGDQSFAQAFPWDLQRCQGCHRCTVAANHHHSVDLLGAIRVSNGYVDLVSADA